MHDTGEGSISRHHPEPRRRPGLGDRLGLLRLPRRAGPLQRGEVRRRSQRSGRFASSRSSCAGRQARPRWRAARPEGHRQIAEAARRAGRARTASRRRRTASSRRRSSCSNSVAGCAGSRAASRSASSSASATLGMVRDLQGDAGDRPDARLHRRRRRRGRHRRGTAGVLRPCGRAAAGGAAAGAQHAGRPEPARPHPPGRRSGKIVSAFDIARAMALGADWCNAARGFMFALGLHPGTALPHRRLPDRRGDAGPAAAEGAGGARQDRARGAATTATRWQRCRSWCRPPGLHHPGEITAAHLVRRVANDQVRLLANHLCFLRPGELLAAEPRRG